MRAFLNSPHPYAILTILLWAFAYVLTRIALQYFSPLPLAFLRFLAAGLAMLAIVVPRGVRWPRREDWKLVLAGGAMGIFLYMTCFNVGTGMVTAATSSVVIATSPVFTSLLSRVILGERLSWVKWFAIAMGFAGVAVIALMDGVLSLNAGVLWLFGASVMFSCYTIILRLLTKRCGTLAASSHCLLAGAVMLAVYAPLAAGEAVHAPWPQILCVVLLGVFPGAIAFLLWTKALDKAENTASVGNYLFVTPFITAVLGFVMIDETPDKATLLGGAVIMAGLFLFIFGDRMGARKAPAPSPVALKE